MRSPAAGTTELLSLALTLNLPSCHVFLNALLSYSLFKAVVLQMQCCRFASPSPSRLGQRTERVMSASVRMRTLRLWAAIFLFVPLFTAIRMEVVEGKEESRQQFQREVARL